MIKTLLISSLLSAVLASNGCPKIISKREWGGKISDKENISHSVSYVIIHHTVTSSCQGEKCHPQLQRIQDQHLKNTWKDIGYNFLIDEAGNIYEGRGWGTRGSHATNYNSRSIGIAVLGNYMENTPTAATMTAIKNLIDCGVTKKYISSNYKLLGHRQTKATKCPGDVLYKAIEKLEHFSSNP